MPDHDNLKVIDIDPCLDVEYSLFYNINEIPTVSREVLKQMLPYESMALKMGIRRSDHVPTCEYEDEKRKYLQHVRFWNYVLDEYKINLIVTHCMPHSQGGYVIYGLAKIKNIPFLIYDRPGVFDERKFWGDSIEEMGRSVATRYEELTDARIDEFELDKDIERDYNKLITRMNSGNISRSTSSAKSILEFKRDFWKYYRLRRNTFLREYYHYSLRALLKPTTIVDLKKREIWFRLRKKQLRSLKYYIKTQCYGLAEYNKFAEDPDYSKKYICFFLQIYPEASLIPLAGVFAEQYNSIQLLARAAEKVGCYVYVREHPATAFRSKDLISEIKSINNVRIVKEEISALDLMRNSIGVATQTGTCILEAATLSKPSFVFSEGYFYKGLPGVYEITDEYQCSDIIASVSNGISVDPKDVRRYIYAIQLETIKEVTVSEEVKRVMNADYEVPPFPLQDRVDLIRRFIETHLL